MARGWEMEPQLGVKLGVEPQASVMERQIDVKWLWLWLYSRP